MTEEILANGAHEIKRKIKGALLDRDMTQVELAGMLKVNPQVLNRAIHGDMSPRSIEIREQVYKLLGI
ncbi:transcriptional regulator [uncultured Secundilactobacillus sp.]|uniref:helix-turn-helix domain-containing protein n=1 Tax=uncultured Secundilactobacillus sp. TaxID=2813935 RepID=UPI00258E8395|nr:transcriptional regulator [uncultured Secundilactobacillus sp.]